MIPENPATGPDVPSPCVGICIIGAEGWCIGCFRTRDELQRWWTSSPAGKREILAACERRASGPA